MSEHGQPTMRRTGLPTPSTVLRETQLRPPARSAVESPHAQAERPITYRILRTNQMDPYDQALTEAEIITLGRERIVGDDFRGTARRAAKLSIANAETEVFGDLSGLIASLPTDATMVHRRRPIRVEARSRRVREEKRNVRLRAFLYAASREADNDYHLIVGRDPSLSPLYMTMELSGLPRTNSAHFQQLQAARGAYTAFFGAQLPGASYDFYDPPIALDIAGSLFFDMSHAAGGRPGPQDLRPDMPVIWEIHPIVAIVLEP